MKIPAPGFSSFLLIILFNYPTMSQLKSELNEFKKLDCEILIQKAMQIMQHAMPELCTHEKRFEVENFEKIVLIESKDDLRISFGQIFQYIEDDKPLIYCFSVDLISKNISIPELPDGFDWRDKEVMFYKASDKSLKAVESILKAHYKLDQNNADSIQDVYRSLCDIVWDIHEKVDRYEIVSDSWSTRAWMNIKKRDLTIDHERHKHYARSPNEKNAEVIIKLSPPVLTIVSGK
jgi:hypothetical protein